MSTLSKDQSILERLSSLEEKDDAKTREIKKLQHKITALQSENFELKSELAVIQDENMTMKEKVKVMEKKMANLHQDSPDMNKTPRQDSRTDTNDSRISALEKNVKQDKKDFKKQITNLASKVKDVKSAVNQMSGLQKVLNRCMVNRQDVNKKVDDLCQRTKTIESRQGNVLQSLTSVKMEARGEDSTGYQFLKRCNWLFEKRGVFDCRTDCLKPQCDGEYCVGVLYVQEGEGVLDVMLDWDDSGPGVRRVGRTVSHRDASFGIGCLSLKKGQKVWVKALLLEGKAEIEWCQVFFWLLG